MSILYTSYTCVVMHWAMSIVRLGVCFDIVWSVMLPYCTKKNLYLDFNVSHQSRQDGQVIFINRNGCNEVFVQIFDELLKGVHVRLSRSLESFTDHIGGFRNVSLNIPTVSNLLTESSSS